MNQNHSLTKYFPSICRPYNNCGRRGSWKESEGQEKVQEIPASAVDCVQIEIPCTGTTFGRWACVVNWRNWNGWILLCIIYSCNQFQGK